MFNTFELNLKESELKLVQLVYNDKMNFIELLGKVDSNLFIDENMKLLYKYASILYGKYDYDRLDFEKLNIIISSSTDIDENIKSFLKIYIEILQVNYNLDVKGEYELYSKNLGLYKFSKFIEEENNGLDNLYKKLNNIDYNTDDIRDFLIYNVNNCFDKYKSKPKESMLEDGMEELIQNIDNNKMELGIRQIFNKYTNYYTGGVFKGVHFLGATSGKGKSTWVLPFYLLPILLAKDENLEMNEKILIIANEQDKIVFQKMILVCVYTYLYRLEKENEVLKDRYIRRHRLERGNASNLDKKLLKDTFKYYESNFKNRIKFVFMPKFTPEDIEHCIKQNSLLGFKNVILDTMKAEQKGEYKLLSNLATKLDMISKSNDLRIIATVQLAIHSMNRKYLDHTCLAESKQIVEIAEHSLYFRYTDLTELGGLNVFRYDKIYNKENKLIKIEKVRYNIDELSLLLDNGDLNQKDKYLGMKFMLIFVGKNRHGESDKVILARFNFDNYVFEEIGVVEDLKYDNI